jgi:serine/threonine-protein kinase RIO1
MYRLTENLDFIVNNKGNIITFCSIYNIYKKSKGVIIDLKIKDNDKPMTTTFLRLKCLNTNKYYEININQYLYFDIKQTSKRRSNFKILVDNFLKQKNKF